MKRSRRDRHADFSPKGSRREGNTDLGRRRDRDDSDLSSRRRSRVRRRSGDTKRRRQDRYGGLNDLDSYSSDDLYGSRDDSDPSPRRSSCRHDTGEHLSVREWGSVDHRPHGWERGFDNHRSGGRDRGHSGRRSNGRDRAHEDGPLSGRDRGHGDRRTSGRLRGHNDRRSSGLDRGYDEQPSSGLNKGHASRPSSPRDRGHNDRRFTGRDLGHDDHRSSGKGVNIYKKEKESVWRSNTSSNRRRVEGCSTRSRERFSRKEAGFYDKKMEETDSHINESKAEGGTTTSTGRASAGSNKILQIERGLETAIHDPSDGSSRLVISRGLEEAFSNDSNIWATSQHARDELVPKGCLPFCSIDNFYEARVLRSHDKFPRKTIVKLYTKDSSEKGVQNMKTYYDMLCSLRSMPNILQVQSYSIRGADQVIECERVHTTFWNYLNTYLELLCTPFDEERITDFTGLLIRKILDVGRVLDNLHRRGMYHGKLCLKNVFVTLDSIYEVTEHEHAVIKLSFPDFEIDPNLATEVLEAQASDGRGTSSWKIIHIQRQDFIHLGNFVSEISMVVGTDANPQIQQLIYNLRNGIIFCYEHMQIEPGLWVPPIMVMVLLRVYEILKPHEFKQIKDFDRSWRKRFDDIFTRVCDVIMRLKEPIDPEFQVLDPQPSTSVAAEAPARSLDMLKFGFFKHGRDVVLHLDRPGMEPVQEKTGNHGDAMRLFRGHHPSLITDLLCLAHEICIEDRVVRGQKLDNLMDDIRRLM